MKSWSVTVAKTRFSEMLNACVVEGPQLVTKRGAEAAVLVPVDEWRRLKAQSKPSLKELLLAEQPNFDLPISPRGRAKRRPLPVF